MPETGVCTLSPPCRRRYSLHAPGTAGPVAVVEVQFLALQDEGTDAILRNVQHVCLHTCREGACLLTRATETCGSARIVMVWWLAT